MKTKMIIIKTKKKLKRFYEKQNKVEIKKDIEN